MKMLKLVSIAAAITAGLCSVISLPSYAQKPGGYTILAQHLNAPRGLRFGPDEYLYVAEAGTGGSTPSAKTKDCTVPTPPGPYTGGKTGRISKISPSGVVTTVAQGFPSAQDAMGDLISVADVAFLKGTLYALVAGGGCSHGNPDSPSGIAQVDGDTGKWWLIANLSAYLRNHPAAFESADDFEPDGTLYSMIAGDDVLYTVEPNHGQVFSVRPNGSIRQVIDISASEGHIVPTSIARRNDDFYVGNLNLFPIDPQWARILTISRGDSDDESDLAAGFGQKGYRIINSKAGFTTVVAVDFGPDGLLYALELSDGPGGPAVGLGKVVRVKRSGEIEEVITELNVPTGMTFDKEGRLYISDFGAAPAALPGAGRILRFDIAP